MDYPQCWERSASVGSQGSHTVITLCSPPPAALSLESKSAMCDWMSYLWTDPVRSTLVLTDCSRQNTAEGKDTRPTLILRCWNGKNASVKLLFSLLVYICSSEFLFVWWNSNMLKCKSRANSIVPSILMTAILITEDTSTKYQTIPFVRYIWNVWNN